MNYAEAQKILRDMQTGREVNLSTESLMEWQQAMDKGPPVELKPGEWNLSYIPPPHHEQARQAIAEGDIDGLTCLIDNHNTGRFLANNIAPALAAGIYEPLLVDAWMMSPTGNYSAKQWEQWFRMADRQKLMKAAPFPEATGQRVTVYRGTTTPRALCRPAWTLSLGCACWFATREGEAGTVYELEAATEAALLYSDDRNEAEAVFLPSWLRRQRARMRPVGLGLSEMQRAGEGWRAETQIDMGKL